LGGGVIYFFFVIRSYYLLSRTLQETRDYTRQVIASMAHGVVSIDTDGKVVSWNQQASSLLGMPAAARPARPARRFSILRKRASPGRSKTACP
jgi:two-component system sensor histidine kinase HydH